MHQVSVLNHIASAKTGRMAVLSCSAHFGKLKSFPFQHVFNDSRSLEMIAVLHSNTSAYI